MLKLDAFSSFEWRALMLFQLVNHKMCILGRGPGAPSLLGFVMGSESVFNIL